MPKRRAGIIPDLYVSGLTLLRNRSSLHESWLRNIPHPKQSGQIIDEIERMREELLTVQNALQKLEANTPDSPRSNKSK